MFIFMNVHSKINKRIWFKFVYNDDHGGDVHNWGYGYGYSYSTAWTSSDLSATSADSVFLITSGSTGSLIEVV